VPVILVEVSSVPLKAMVLIRHTFFLAVG